MVVDSGGNIYGHLVAGDLENRIGYIIPATQTFESMKQQIGDGLSTIRPSLTALDALIPPKSSEPSETRLSTTQPQLNDLGGPSFLEARHQTKASSDTLRSIRQQDTSSSPTSSEARAAYRLIFSQTVSSTNAAPTIPSAPRFWDDIEPAGPSLPQNSLLEERKHSEKTPRRETPTPSSTGPSRRQLALRKSYPFIKVDRWRWDPLARAGYEHVSCT